MTRRLHAVPDPVAEDLAAQDSSLDVECPRCEAPRDAYCVGTVTGQPMRASHWQRITAAGAQMPEDAPSGPWTPDTPGSAVYGALRAHSGAPGVGSPTPAAGEVDEWPRF